ncbi:MAG: hypothetical protein ANABAC_1331 [Anaerolineae bacterium]|nr:MAG: hypothetical protein ANABAC_1331 [Anaerolineae bacterium]
MADFCKDCATRNFGEGTPPDIYAEAGTVIWELCEGCGWGLFDENGHRVEVEIGDGKDDGPATRL